MNRWTIEPCKTPPDGTFYVISPQGEALSTTMPDGGHYLLAFDAMSDAARVADLMNEVYPTCVL